MSDTIDISARGAGSAEEGVGPPQGPAARLYVGRVMHRRLRPFGHRFVYRVFSLLIDIDRIDEVAAGSRLFSHNRFNLFGYDDRDHGPPDAVSTDGARATPDAERDSCSRLRQWLEGHLDAAGIDIDHGRIRLLCFPRVLGYVFNPLSVYYCYHSDERLAAILYEVHNTFGDRHTYLFRVDGSEGTSPDRSRPAVLTHGADKVFHVSPFIDMTPRYRFRIREPGDDLSILIREADAGGDLLLATLHGRAVSFSDRNLAKLFVTHPLMTLKVIAAIHWQAFRLWRKGARFYSRPEPPPEELTMR